MIMRFIAIAAVAVIMPTSGGCYGDEFNTAIPETSQFKEVSDPTVVVMSNGVQLIISEPSGLESNLGRRKDSNATRRPFTVFWIKNQNGARRITDYKCGKGEIEVDGKRLLGRAFTIDGELAMTEAVAPRSPQLLRPITAPLK